MNERENNTAPLEIKPFALKRKAVSNGDKVRYRVYVSATEFVAVIAENALMAMKVSGITAPVRIMRDLPMSAASIDQSRLTTHHTHPTAFLRPDLPSPSSQGFVDNLNGTHPSSGIGFESVSLSALHKKNMSGVSMIDAATMLRSLSNDLLPTDALPIERDPPRFVSRKSPTANPEDTFSTVSEQVVESAPAIGKQKEIIAPLSPDDIEALLNEPRA